MWVKCAVVFAATIAVLHAQQWEVAPVGGYLRLSKKPIGSLNQTTPKDDDTKLAPRQPAYGLTVTLNTKGYYGVEAGVLRSRARIESNIDPGDGKPVVERGTVTQTQTFLNGVSYFMPRGERFRPYATAGFQAQFWNTPNLPNWSGRNSKNIGFNYGGGVKIRLAKPVLFRLDVRDIWAGAPYGLQYGNSSDTSLRSPGLYRQLQGTVGIGIMF
jgi:opacity protein-like surface antigen